MTTKMKGLLKGLRYISLKLESEKEPEMMIGFPTDVKHVAHIGWDGPSVDSPSWINEFKPPSANGGGQANKDCSSSTQKSVSEGLSTSGAVSPRSESTSRELPKPRRHSSTSASTSAIESPTKIKTEKHRTSRRAASKASLGRDPTEVASSSDNTPRSSVELEVEESPRKKQQQPDVPKKLSTRKKKPSSSKDGTGAQPRSSSRLSGSKASSSTDDNNNEYIPSLKEERGKNRQGQGHATVS